MKSATESARDPQTRISALAWAFFIGSVFLAAFLAFEIQPLVGKIVTPKFGGGVNVWSICILYFQTALLGGYLLTFVLNRLPAAVQCTIYGALFVISAVGSGIAPPAAWTPSDWNNPEFTLLTMLIRHLAVPSILLFSVSGMIQIWFAEIRLGNPYPLYSVSNVGSLTALLAYPLVIEPNLSLSTTLGIWRVGYVLLAGLVAISACVRFMWNKFATPAHDLESDNTAVSTVTSSSTSLKKYSWWILLSALSSMCLVAYTALLTQEIAPVPFLFILPLCLFLLSFILCFSDKSLYRRTVFAYLTPFVWLLQSPMYLRHLLPIEDNGSLVAYNIAVVLLFVFCFSMLCQGELAASKPHPKYLPTFYLAIAFGGCLGSGFVNFVAPQIFNVYAEPFLIGIFLLLYFRTFALETNEADPKKRWSTFPYLGALYLLVIAVSFFGLRQPSNVVAEARNFYGCYRIVLYDDAIGLFDGDTLHGLQWQSPEKKQEPTKYYARDTGLGFSEKLLRHRNTGPLKIAGIGLGAGTIATYGQPNDEIVFYEIDPKVLSAAKEYFSFLKDSKAKVSVEIGDGRAQLERAAGDKQFDLIVVDAFNGDAVPVHLLTLEAAKVYLAKLQPHGFLLFHISNRYLDLEPIVGNMARALGLNAWTIDSAEATWVLISRDQLPELKFPRTRVNDRLRLWTDDYSNVFSVVELNRLKPAR